MNEETLIWLFGSIFAVFGAWNLVLTGLWWSTRNDIKDTKLAVDLFIQGMGKAASRIIHRDDDLWGIDKLLEKYEAKEELSLDEWMTLEALMKRLKNDKSISEGTKLALATVCSSLLAAFARHKIYGKDPRVKEAVKQALNK